MSHKGKSKDAYYRIEYDNAVFKEKWWTFTIWTATQCQRKVVFSESFADFFSEEDANKFRNEIMAP